MLTHPRPGMAHRLGQGTRDCRRNRRARHCTTWDQFEQTRDRIAPGHRRAPREHQRASCRQRLRTIRGQPISRGDASDHGHLIRDQKRSISEGDRGGADTSGYGDRLVDDRRYRFFFASDVEHLGGSQGVLDCFWDHQVGVVQEFLQSEYRRVMEGVAYGVREDNAAVGPKGQAKGLDVRRELQRFRMDDAVASGDLRHDHDHRQPEICQRPNEHRLSSLEAAIRPPNEIPGRMDLSVHGQRTLIADDASKALDDRITRRSRLEALAVVQAEESVRMPVVDQSLRHWLTDSRSRNIASEDRIHQGRLAYTGLAEDCQVEAPQGRERVGQLLFEQSLNLIARQIGNAWIRNLIGHPSTVREAGEFTGYRGRVKLMRRTIALVVLAVVLIAGFGAWSVYRTVRDAGILQDGLFGSGVMASPVVVPVEYRDLIKRAAKRCPAVPLEVFAAQIAAESSWDAEAVSPDGALGIAQFMPDVWDQYGIDANRDGKVKVKDPRDAIHSAAELNCANRRLVKDASGDRLANTLAAYNAGFAAVLKYDGVPPYPETEAYVEKILRTSKTIVIEE